MNRLRSVRYEDLSSLADTHVLARGRDCVRWGLIHDLSESQGQIEAMVAERRGEACRVIVREGTRGLVTWCTCADHVEHGETCKHIVAALVAWIARRDGGAAAAASGAGEEAASPGAGRPADPLTSLRSVIRLLGGPGDPGRRAAPTSWEEREEPLPEPAALLAAALPGSAPLRVVVDRGGHTHGLIVSVRRSRARGGGAPGESPGRPSIVSLAIPPGDVPAALRELDEAEEPLWSEAAAALKIYYSPVRMRLRADYALSGVLVLTPVAQVRDSRGSTRQIEPIHLHEGLDGTMWVEDGPDRLRRVGMWTSLMERYAPDFKPRILEGMEVVEFLTEGHETDWRGGLEPSERVRSSRVFNEVRLASVEVSEEPGGWLWLDPQYRAGDHRLALGDILQAQRSGGLLRRGDDWIVLRTGATWTRGGRIKTEEARERDLLGSTFPEGGVLDAGRIRAPRLAYLRQRAEWGPEVEVQADPALARFEALLRREGTPPRAPKLVGMKGRLRPYQVVGYKWLWFLREAGLGGILADEMGLGKTHQVMALLLSVYRERRKRGEAVLGPSLVICPRSVLEHWETKVLAHAPSLKPLVYHGSAREHAREDLSHRRLVLTTYGVLARDVEHLSRIRWEHVILDEAQYVKNSATKAARAARKLQAEHRLALSGTPLENHLEELRSVSDFVLPGYLGSAEWFRRRFARPIEGGDGQALEVLKRAIQPFKLRRLKAQVLTDLPPKIEDVRFASLTTHQAVLYQEILSRARASGLLDRLRNRSERVDYAHVFAILSHLKRLCDHPSLVLEGRSTRNLASGKFDLFKELMAEALDAGEKVVVFSQYLGMLDLIEEHLGRSGVRYSGLRGATQRRAAAIRRFQKEKDCRVFVASLLAGGLGVDLTAGSVVIHYDRWWNAAREDQATDRVHRIGQSCGVQVFRLITRGTLEDRIDAIISHKRRLADRLLEADPALGLKHLSRDELISILQPPELPKEPLPA